MTSAGVVIPVRNGAALLGACLESIVPQASAHGAPVIVVDDASTDASADVARGVGARVLRLEEPAGPYAARNRGWRSLDADVVVFTDARCRARPGWLAALVRALEEPDVAVVGGDVWVSAGDGLAARTARRRQPLLARRSVQDRYLPFVPTCALATRRDLLDRLGGFVEVRGGADVDLCWRAQLAGLGKVALAAGAEMDWAPRDGIRALLAQHRRYGANTRWLQDRFAPHGCPVDLDAPRWKVLGAALRDAAASASRTGPREWPVLALDAACAVAASDGHRKIATPAQPVELAR